MVYTKRTVKNRKKIKRKTTTFKKQNVRTLRKSHNIQRGGGWLGPRITEPDNDDVNIGKLMENNYYAANKDDKTLFDIENLPKSIELFNAYLKTKEKILIKGKKIKQARFANITVLGAKLKKCNNLLKADLIGSLCLIVKYHQRELGSLIENFRMIGPLQIFVNKKTRKLELPFLALLHLLELRFSASEIKDEESFLTTTTKVQHRLSLLVDDVPEVEYDDDAQFSIKDPSKVTTNVSDKKLNEFAEALFRRRREFKEHGYHYQDLPRVDSSIRDFHTGPVFDGPVSAPPLSKVPAVAPVSASASASAFAPAPVVTSGNAPASAPARQSSAPVAASPVPVAASPVPVTASPAPVAASPVPVAASPAPVAASPAPVAASPAPVAASPAPVATGRFVVTTISNF